MPRPDKRLWVMVLTANVALIGAALCVDKFAALFPGVVVVMAGYILIEDWWKERT
jgi:hypothetical protein